MPSTQQHAYNEHWSLQKRMSKAGFEMHIDVTGTWYLEAEQKMFTYMLKASAHAQGMQSIWITFFPLYLNFLTILACL